MTDSFSCEWESAYVTPSVQDLPLISKIVWH
jgi:hypothetical protein